MTWKDLLLTGGAVFSIPSGSNEKKLLTPPDAIDVEAIGRLARGDVVPE